MRHLAVVIALAAGVGIALIVGQSTHVPTTAPSPQPTVIETTTEAPSARTPGALNPDVTQATIATTICRRGWTATVRPPASYTDALKVRQIAAYHLADTNPRDYELDHKIPLELGGAPKDPANLWPELWPDAHRKDALENSLHRQVCAGTLSLAAAQAQIEAWPR